MTSASSYVFHIAQPCVFYYSSNILGLRWISCVFKSFFTGTIVLVLVLADYMVLEKSLFFHFSFKGWKSVQIVLKTVSVTWDTCRAVVELNGFTAKSAKVPVRPITQFRFWKCNLLRTCVPEHTSILWCSLFSDLTFYVVTKNFTNKKSSW